MHASNALSECLCKPNKGMWTQKNVDYDRYAAMGDPTVTRCSHDVDNQEVDLIPYLTCFRLSVLEPLP